MGLIFASVKFSMVKLIMDNSDTIPMNDLIREAVAAGLAYGHKKTKTHPRMKKYVSMKKNEIDVLDPEASLQSLGIAIDFLSEKARQGGLLLLVGTQPAAQELMKNIAEEFNFPYVIERWLGGTLTNFKVISGRVARYETLKKEMAEGGLDKYTKKERLDIHKEFAKMEKNFKGLVNLKRLPDALLVIDPGLHDTAMREAKRLSIPVAAIMDTDDDPEAGDYPIIANDHAKSSISWIMEKIAEAIKSAKTEIAEIAESKPPAEDSGQSV